MFGNDGDDHHGLDPGDIGALLFGWLVYREVQAGRLDAGGCLRAGCLIVAIIGAVIGGGLLLLGTIGSLATPGYGGFAPIETYAPFPTERPAIVVPATARPAPTPAPTAEPTPTPKPTPMPGIGDRVPAGDGWAVTVTKVQRWRPAWYDEPGWRLVTVHVKVRMPAVEYECVLGSTFWLRARSGREYQGFEWQRLREPGLFACSDYHRPTTAAGWVTFEVRDADAKGLVLLTWLAAGDEPLEIALK